MLVARPRIDARDDGLVLSAEVTFETPERSRMQIWFRVPHDVALPSNLGDPFLVGMLVSAMTLGEDLEIDAPISSSLLRSVEDRLSPVLRRWGWDFGTTGGCKIRCDEQPDEAPPTAPRGRASFFSGGVDSWYTVLKRRQELDQLIYVRGVDISVHNDRRWKPALEFTRESVRELGMPLIVMETNIQEMALHEIPNRLTELGRPMRYFSVERFFGTMLVALSLLLQRSLSEIVIPASWSYDHLEPLGSHWLLEPSLSSELQRYEIDGGEQGRLGKIQAILCARPEALRRIRVCFAKDSAELNCGACEKCIRTMIEIYLAGGGDLLDSFALPLTLEGVSKVKARAFMLYFWREVEDEARALGDHQLARAIQVATKRRFNWPKLRRRFLGEGISENWHTRLS